MSACNSFSESIIHMACRRANLSIVQFLLCHDTDLHMIDDYGRNILHDTCWRADCDFTLVHSLLSSCQKLFWLADIRGSLPLDYIRQEYWNKWCAFFYLQRNVYWPIITTKTTTTTATAIVTAGVEKQQQEKREGAKEE